MAGLAGAVGTPPTHYAGDGVTPFEVIDAYELGFFDGNAFKYLSRWDLKGTPVGDLKKALHYTEETIIRWTREGWLDWKRARVGNLTPENVAAGFRLATSNPGDTEDMHYARPYVREAMIHLLYWKTDNKPTEDLSACKRYIERAIRELEHV